MPWQVLLPSENLARCLLGFDFPFPRRLVGLTEDAESSGGRGGLLGRPSSPPALNFCRLASDATLCSLGASGNPAPPQRGFGKLQLQCCPQPRFPYICLRRLRYASHGSVVTLCGPLENAQVLISSYIHSCCAKRVLLVELICAHALPHITTGKLQPLSSLAVCAGQAEGGCAPSR